MYLLILLYFVFGIKDQVLEVKVTTYYINGKTASGLSTKAIDEPFVAVSRDLIQQYPIGSYIYLSNCKWEGMYKVMDKMGKSKSKAIDVYSPKRKAGQVRCSCAEVK